MITNDFRPRTFSELAGQELNKRVLKSIVDKPYNAPRSLIFQGSFGTGKTTMARVFSRALNCNDDSEVEPCMTCSTCLSDIQDSPYYEEYDAAIVGNVNKIRELRDTFQYTIHGGWKVVVLDEIHLASKQAQSALLKVIEEAPERVFFLFCTTDIDMILPTIRSRSLELHFRLIDKKEIIKNLNSILDKKDIEASPKIVDLIASRSRGHMRNAHMYLDQYLMIGEEDFKEVARSARNIFLKFFLATAAKKEEAALHFIDELLTFPLADLKIDFQQAVLDVTEGMFTTIESDELVQKVAKRYKSNIMKLIKYSMSDWVLNSFETDETFKACFLNFYRTLSKSSSNKRGSRDLRKSAKKR